MMSENYLYKSPTHAANLSEMRMSGKLCDVMIKVENKEFHAHKVILAANLKYFQSMFSNSFQEIKFDVISIKSVKGSDFEAFVNFAYTGEMLLTKTNALDLLKLADHLDEDCIKTACITFLEVNLDANDAFRAFHFANTIKCLALKNAAKLRIHTNFEYWSQTCEYLGLDFKILIDVMNDVKFGNVEHQQVLFEGIMRWILHNSEERRSHVNDLLCLIDVANLADGYLVNYVGTMANLSDRDYVIIKDVMSYHHNHSKIEQAKSPVKNAAEALMLLQDIDGTSFSHIYNFTEKKWSSLQKIPNYCGIICWNSAVLHNRIYYRSNVPRQCRFVMFDPTIRQTTILDSLTVYGELAICACDRFVYICGGRNGMEGILGSTNQIMRYDPQTNRKETLTSMKTKRHSAAAIFYQGHLCVSGGHSGQFCLNSVEQYDFGTQKWTAFPPMIIPRLRHAVAVLDGKLYACGGGNGTSSVEVEVYDPAKNSWQRVANMNKQRWKFHVVTYEGKLWAIGGDQEKTIEVYDPNNNEWQMDDEMSSGLEMKHPAGGLISASRITDAQ